LFEKHGLMPRPLHSSHAAWIRGGAGRGRCSGAS
jgi:hypothetical protein